VALRPGEIYTQSVAESIEEYLPNLTKVIRWCPKLGFNPCSGARLFTIQKPKHLSKKKTHEYQFEQLVYDSCVP